MARLALQNYATQIKANGQTACFCSIRQKNRKSSYLDLMVIDMKLYHTHTCLPLMYIRGIRKFVHIIDKGPYSLQCRYHFLNVSRPRKSIPYCIGRYGRYIPYQPVHQYRCPSCFVSKKILAVPASYQPCQRNSAVLADKWIPSKDREIPKKILMNFQNLPKTAALGWSRSQSWSHSASYHYRQPKPTDPNP